MKVLRRDDTEHGVDYVTLHEAQTAIEDATHELRNAESELSISNAERDHFRRENIELRQALSGRTVSCSNCNALAAENVAMKEVIKESHDALDDCVTRLVGWHGLYESQLGKDDHDAFTKGDKALTKLQPFLK